VSIVAGEGHPYFRKEAAGVKLRQHAGINCVRLDFGVCDHSHLDGIGDHHSPRGLVSIELSLARG
jgi:hypothetical protein